MINSGVVDALLQDFRMFEQDLQFPSRKNGFADFDELSRY
jgi:hypothetical protein